MAPEPHSPDFEPLVGPYLARQDWAQSVLHAYGAAIVPAEIIDVEVLRSVLPGLASVVVASGADVFHLVLGWRELSVAPGMLGARPHAVLGPGNDGETDVLVYDAMADSDLVVDLLRAASGGNAEARQARLVQSLVSHSSVVYDDRLFMKCYRVIEPRPRPEIEMMLRLDAVGFNHMLAPVAHWARGGRDLALVREFIPGAIEGKALALTSLRDLLARAEPGAAGDAAAFERVGLAGGDLGPEMRRLGETTAQMHLALQAAFGGSHEDGIRLHGDYHLRRVMRTDAGWLVAGFGDDPLLGADAGTASTGEPVMASPLEDLADMCFSLRQAAAEALRFQPPSTVAHAQALATGWEQHNIRELLKGYGSVGEVSALVPGDAAVFGPALAALVEDRAAVAR
jgi:maltokinase